MLKKASLLVLAFLMTVCLVWPAMAFEPGTCECIAPANPGGGWDFTCRTIGQLLYDMKIVPTPVKVVNMPGGGGGVAYAHVITQRNSDENLLVAASTATTSRLAGKQFKDFTAADVRWVAALGADFGAIAVKADSPYKTLDDLVKAWRENPDALAIGGGSAVGGQDHLKVLVLANGTGVDIKKLKYVHFAGGGEALTSLLGGFIQVFPGDVSEVKPMLEAGKIRVLAVLSPERIQDEIYKDIPTAKELGYDVEWTVFRGFFMPKGVSDDVYNFWVDALHKVEQSKEWAEIRQSNAMAPFWRGGDEFDQYVNKQIVQLQTLIKELGL